MKKPNKSLMSVVFMLLWVAVGDAKAGTDDLPACDYTSFESYFRRFADDAALQQNNTASDVNVTTLHRDGEDLKPLTKQASQDALIFPIVPDSKTRKNQQIDIIIYDDNRAIVMDKLGQYFRTYSFSGKSCETLTTIEDWTVGRDVLLVNAEPGLSEKGNLCLKRGEFLSALASPEEHWSLVQMFEAALQNYLCAAAEGSWRSASYAVALSLSGQAPRLKKPQILSLAEFAAEHDANSAYRLSGFYCDEGEYAEQGPCKNPKKAEEMLVKSAKMGSEYAVVELADSYERGLLVTKSMQKALACYKLAVQKGQDQFVEDVARLSTQVTGDLAEEKCF